MATVDEQRTSNKHGKIGTTEASFIKLRDPRDATLGEPKLLHPSLQVNIRAGKLPPPDASNEASLKRRSEATPVIYIHIYHCQVCAIDIQYAIECISSNKSVAQVIAMLREHYVLPGGLSSNYRLRDPRARLQIFSDCAPAPQCGWRRISRQGAWRRRTLRQIHAGIWSRTWWID